MTTTEEEGTVRGAVRTAVERVLARPTLLAFGLLAGFPFAVTFATVVATLDPGTSAAVRGATTVLFPVLAGFVLVAAAADSREDADRAVVESMGAVPRVVGGWLVYTLVWLAGTLLAFFVLGNLVGAVHAVGRALAYAAGATLAVGSFPPITPEVLALFVGLVLASAALASIPLQFALPLLVLDDRGPLGAVRASLSYTRRRPRRALGYAAVRLGLTAVPLLTYVLVVVLGVAGPQRRTERTLVTIREVIVWETASPSEMLLYGGVALVLAALANTLLYAFAAVFLDRSVAPVLAADPDEDPSPGTRLLAPRVVAVVLAVLLVVSATTTYVRVTEVRPTPSVAENVEGVDDPGELLAVARENIDRTSHRSVWTSTGTTRIRVVDRNTSATIHSVQYDGYVHEVVVYDHDSRHGAAYIERASGPDPSPSVTAAFAGDGGAFFTGAGNRSPVRIRPGPDDGDMERVWSAPELWDVPVSSSTTVDGPGVPSRLEPGPAQRRSLSVVERNDSTVVLGIDDPVEAYLYWQGGAELYDRVVGPDDDRSAEQLLDPPGEPDSYSEEYTSAVRVHEGSVRIHVDVDTGRITRLVGAFERTTIREETNLGNVYGIEADRRGSFFVYENESRRTVLSISEYGTADAPRPAGVQGEFGRLNKNSLLSRLIDYVIY